MTRRERERAELGRGLHKVGPAPHDYVYNPAEGQRVTAVALDGTSYTGTLTEVVEDDESGEMTLTVQQWPDPVLQQEEIQP